MIRKNNIPKGYKSSPLGPIPIEWELKPLGTFAKITSGGTPSRKKQSYWNGDIPWITTSLIDFNEINEAEEFITEEGLKNSAAKLFPSGTLLLALYGQGVTRGKTAILNIEAATNQACAAIMLDKKQVRKQFVFQYLIFSYDDIRKLSNSGSQENLNGELVKSIPVLIPPIKEQAAITQLLITWDSAINKIAQLIYKKEQRKTWLMQQLLTGTKRLKGFKEKRVKHHYIDLLRVVKRQVEWDDNKIYHLISVRRKSGGIFERESLRGDQIKVKDLRTAKEGDFLFSKMQIVHGASALVDKKFAGSKISGSYIAVVAKDAGILSMEYFDWYSKTPYFYHQTYISSYGVHIEKMTFDFESFLTLDIHLPSVKEQRAIVEVLSAANNEVELLKEKLKSIKQQKKGLMQMLLTGKKRLKI